MADRSIAAGDTLNKLRFEFNGTAEDIGCLLYTSPSPRDPE